MSPAEIEKLKAMAAHGWHAAEAYIRGDGQIAMSTPRGHPLAPSVARLLEDRERLLAALKPIVERLDGDREFVIPDGGAEMLHAARDAIAKAEAP